jgi:hypothetical protein
VLTHGRSGTIALVDPPICTRLVNELVAFRRFGRHVREFATTGEQYRRANATLAAILGESPELERQLEADLELAREREQGLFSMPPAVRLDDVWASFWRVIGEAVAGASPVLSRVGVCEVGQGEGEKIHSLGWLSADDTRQLAEHVVGIRESVLRARLVEARLAEGNSVPAELVAELHTALAELDDLRIAHILSRLEEARKTPINRDALDFDVASHLDRLRELADLCKLALAQPCCFLFISTAR